MLTDQLPEKALPCAWGSGYALALALGLGQGALESVEAKIKIPILLNDN